jgi:hypothetical protein
MFDTGRGYWTAFAVFAETNVLGLLLLSRVRPRMVPAVV